MKATVYEKAGLDFTCLVGCLYFLAAEALFISSTKHNHNIGNNRSMYY